ncbi:MAG: hypothetical protein FD152_1936 [Xanthobacteraceae bacterium]|nr:MAG: hypothetical protein FD152_1936 [Xanthobacteraceae bacterium]
MPRILRVVALIALCAVAAITAAADAMPQLADWSAESAIPAHQGRAPSEAGLSPSAHLQPALPC